MSLGAEGGDEYEPHSSDKPDLERTKATKRGGWSLQGNKFKRREQPFPVVNISPEP